LESGIAPSLFLYTILYCSILLHSSFYQSITTKAAVSPITTNLNTWWWPY
jgi:hypothetical protein